MGTKQHGRKILKLPENDSTVTKPVDDSAHNKITYSSKLGNELQLTPYGYRVYHADFDDNEEKSGTFKVAKDTSRCTHVGCGKFRINTTNENEITNYIYDKSEIYLSHYRKLPGKYADMWEGVPATLLIETYHNICRFCKKPYRDTLSDLRDGKKHYTRALAAYIKAISVQSDLTALSKNFSVNKQDVFKWYNEEVARRDDESRNVPQPKSLGLYTLTFNETGRREKYCLCVDEERQTFIGFFPWNDMEKKQNFFDSIQDKKKVTTVFTYWDDIAATESEKIFPNAELVIERSAVIEHIREISEQVFKEQQRLKPELRYMLQDNKEDLLYKEWREYTRNPNEVKRCYEECPILVELCDIYIIMLGLYDSETIDEAETIFDFILISSFDNRKESLQMSRLRSQLKKYRDRIIRFIPLRGQLKTISEERKRYEKLLEAVPRAMTDINSKGKKGAYAARVAGKDYLYGHVMYGVMDRVNNHRIQAYKAKQAIENEKKLTHNELYMMPMHDVIGNNVPELVTYDNFFIPLEEFSEELMLLETPIPEEIPEDYFTSKNLKF